MTDHQPYILTKTVILWLLCGHELERLPGFEDSYQLRAKNGEVSPLFLPVAREVLGMLAEPWLIPHKYRVGHNSILVIHTTEPVEKWSLANGKKTRETKEAAS